MKLLFDTHPPIQLKVLHWDVISYILAVFIHLILNHSDTQPLNNIC